MTACNALSGLSHSLQTVALLGIQCGFLHVSAAVELQSLMQVCFCFTQSVASTRWMIQDEQRIQNTKCDNCLIGDHWSHYLHVLLVSQSCPLLPLNWRVGPEVSTHSVHQQ